MSAARVYRPRIGLAIALGLAIGLVATLALLRLASPPANFIANPIPRYEYEHDAEPSPAQTRSAEYMLEQGNAALAAGDLVEADVFYGHCIQIADLAACHRRLASVLYLARDPGARAHYRLGMNTSDGLEGGFNPRRRRR